MLRYLIDPANAITTFGICCSSLGIFLALSGQLGLGVAAVLWALLADHLDGVVAGRTRNRAPETAAIGKNLDSFADLLSGAVFPAIIVVQALDTKPIALIVATVLLLAGALRLSYFNSFGLSSDGHFTGVPLSYDVPLLAVIFLAAPLIPEASFAAILCLCMLAIACSHVMPLRIPRTSGAMYAVVTVFSVSASGFLAVRELA